MSTLAAACFLFLSEHAKAFERFCNCNVGVSYCTSVQCLVAIIVWHIVPGTLGQGLLSCPLIKVATIRYAAVSYRGVKLATSVTATVPFAVPLLSISSCASDSMSMISLRQLHLLPMAKPGRHAGACRITPAPECCPAAPP